MHTYYSGKAGALGSMPDLDTNLTKAAVLDQQFMLRRLSIVMRPRIDDAYEACGVLNPGGVRAPNGDYLLFPRLVGQGNFSRIGIGKVVYDSVGRPIDVERRGIALEPSMPYELNPLSGGGCEDARVTYVAVLGAYVMAYVAFGLNGPRAALALSSDLYEWRRVGPINLAPHRGADMNVYSNKDAMLFPEPVVGPDGRPSLLLMHRPMYEIFVEGTMSDREHTPLPPGVKSDFWTVWLSYCALDDADWASPSAGSTTKPPTFGNHVELLPPAHAWDSIRIGGGTPPVRLPQGWFTLYHGIGEVSRPGPRQVLRYVAGALVLDTADPRRVIYRSTKPVLEPLLQEECSGVVSDVVFPTAIDEHDTYLDVYYGMADACIGAARMNMPRTGV